jgi:hypothetical protein
MSAMKGRPLAFWSHETGRVHDFSSRHFSGGGFLRRSGHYRSVACPGHRSTSRRPARCSHACFRIILDRLHRHTGIPVESILGRYRCRSHAVSGVDGSLAALATRATFGDARCSRRLGGVLGITFSGLMLGFATQACTMHGHLGESARAESASPY